MTITTRGVIKSIIQQEKTRCNKENFDLISEVLYNNVLFQVNENNPISIQGLQREGVNLYKSNKTYWQASKWIHHFEHHDPCDLEVSRVVMCDVCHRGRLLINWWL